MSLNLLESLIPSGTLGIPNAYDELEEHLIKTFSTFESLNESFLNGKETSLHDPGVDLEAVRMFYTRLQALPCAQTLFLSLIKTSEVLLRRPGRPLKHKDDLRFLLIILENPALAVNFFSASSTLPPSPTKPTSIEEPHSSKPIIPISVSPEIFTSRRQSAAPLQSNIPLSSSPEKSTVRRQSFLASPIKETSHSRQNSASTFIPEAQHTQHSLMKRMYGIISNLPNELHHYLVNWFTRLLAPAVFRRRVEMINSFIAYRLGKHQKRALLSGPSGAGKAQRQLYTNDWQIKASARMMALFFAANTNRPKLDLSEFYNTLVSHSLCVC
jgi:hypothetical protein